MTDREERELVKIEEFYDADTKVSEWVDVYFNKEDGIGEIDKSTLRTYFEGCGATEPRAESRKTLAFKHYGNKSRSKVMREVWGDRYNEFKTFCREYVEDYESEIGKTLPAVEFKHENRPSTFSKTEGMMSFFADMTALAFASDDEYAFQNFDEVNHVREQASRIRSEKGKLSEEDRAKIRITIPGYNNNKPFVPASFPPDFPTKALEKIRTWSTLL